MKKEICRERLLRPSLKRIMSIILSITMLLSITAGLDFSAYADDLPSSGSCGDNVTYTFDSSTGTLTISGTGAMKDYNNDDPPFYNQSSIKKIIINSGVTSIGDYTFCKCSSLTSITIPDSVTSIGYDAFSSCSSLTSVTIGNGVTSIGSFAFCDCSSLTSITIPDSVTSIGYAAFEYCSSLTVINVASGNKNYSSQDGVLFNKAKTELIQYPIGNSRTSYTIPTSVTSIGNYAFYDCDNLTRITIPDSVTSIGNSAFSDCSSLTSITIPDGVTSIGEVAFFGCSSLTSVTIGNGVTSIGDWAFSGCTGLTSITIPDSVTSIGIYAFYECSSLISVTIPDSVTSIGDDTFRKCTSLTSINVASGNENYSSKDGVLFNKAKTELIQYPIGNSRTSYTIPTSVTSIGEDAFSSCSSLTSITIPDSVTSIGGYAFYRCSSLTSVTIPDGVTNIGNYAFFECYSLTSVTIPDGVTNIGNYAFFECYSLTSVTIPDSVTSIGYYAFYGCSSLTDVYYSGSSEAWSKISIGSDNEPLLNATIHYNSSGGENSSGAILAEGTQSFTVYDADKLYEYGWSFKTEKESKNAKLSGVSLNYGSDSKSFDKMTVVNTSELEGKKLTFSKSGYNNFIIPSEVMSDASYTSLMTHSIYMKKSETGKKPYISSVFAQQLNKKNKAKTPYMDMTGEELIILENVNYNVVISAETRGAGNVTYYLSQDDAHKISSSTGVFSKQELYSKFADGKTIYAYAVCGSKTTTPVALKLVKRTLPEAADTFLRNNSLSLLGSSGASITISDNVPLFGGTKVGLDFIKVPVGCEISGDTLRVSLGFDFVNLTEKNGKLESSANEWGFSDYSETSKKWKDYKKLCKEVNVFASKSQKAKKKQKFNDILKKYGIDKKAFSKTFSLDYLGYVEFEITDNGLIVKELSGTLAAEFAYKVTTQAYPFGIPVYLYVKAGAEGTLLVSSGRVVADKNVPLVFDAIVGFEPKVTLGAGLGVHDGLSAGLYAKATAPVTYSIPKKNLKLGVTGEFGAEFTLGPLEVPIELWSGERTLIDKTFGTSSQNAKMRIQYFNGLSDELQSGKVKLASREYLKNQKWVAPSKISKKHFGTGFNTYETTVLEESLNQNPHPEIVSFDDKAMMVWVDDDSERDSYNRFKLVYSIYKDGAWTSPKAVDDCGTNDSAPSLISIGNEVYVAYQNVNKTLTEVNDNTVNELNSNTEIKLAKYNKSSDSFENVQLVTNNSTFDYNPTLAEENGEPVVYWVNFASDDFASASASVMKSNFDGNVSTVLNSKNYIIELKAFGGDVYYTMESNSSDENAYDVNLYKNETALTDNNGSVPEAKPAELTVADFGGAKTLFYATDSNIYRLDGTAPVKEIENRLNLSGQLQVVNNTAVWAEATEYGNEYYSSNYNNGEWSEPVQLCENNGYMSALTLTDYASSLMGAYLFTKRTENKDGSGYENGASTLYSLRTTGTTDISVTPGLFTEESLALNEEYTFGVYVENKGTEDVNSVQFNVSDPFGYTYSETKEVNLKSGEGTVVSLPYVPYEFGVGDLTVFADAAGDINSDNNTAVFELGKADITVSSPVVESVGNYKVVIATVTNNSKLSASGVSVVINNGDTELETVDIGDMEPGEIREIRYELFDGELEYDEEYISKITFNATADNLSETCISSSNAVFENSAAPHEHIWQEASSVEPTCYEGGSKEYYCTVCSEKKSEDVEPLEHNYVETENVPASCTQEGYIVYTCSYCDDVQTQYVEPTGHSFVDGVCEKCGALESETPENPEDPSKTDPRDPDDPSKVDPVEPVTATPDDDKPATTSPNGKQNGSASGKTTAKSSQNNKALAAIKLTLKKVKIKKRAKKLVIKATLKINGKAVKGKKLVFKFNGKKYTAKTNKKGVAKITIKKKVLKKLKKGKKVKYSVSFGGKTVTKKVKVK